MELHPASEHMLKFHQLMDARETFCRTMGIWNKSRLEERPAYVQAVIETIEADARRMLDVAERALGPTIKAIERERDKKRRKKK